MDNPQSLILAVNFRARNRCDIGSAVLFSCRVGGTGLQIEFVRVALARDPVACGIREGSMSHDGGHDLIVADQEKLIGGLRAFTWPGWTCT